jgi:hypothetical protein
MGRVLPTPQSGHRVLHQRAAYGADAATADFGKAYVIRGTGVLRLGLTVKVFSILGLASRRDRRGSWRFPLGHRGCGPPWDQIDTLIICLQRVAILLPLSRQAHGSRQAMHEPELIST